MYLYGPLEGTHFSLLLQTPEVADTIPIAGVPSQLFNRLPGSFQAFPHQSPSAFGVMEVSVSTSS